METWEDVQRQIVRMDAIFILMDAGCSFEECDGLINMVENAYTAIQQMSKNLKIRDLSIMLYLSNIESMEMVSFRVLQNAAISFENKEVRQLLKENFDEAKDGHALMQIITTNYISDRPCQE